MSNATPKKNNDHQTPAENGVMQQGSVLNQKLLPLS
jgi:hypothetical protein